MRAGTLFLARSAARLLSRNPRPPTWPRQHPGRAEGAADRAAREDYGKSSQRPMGSAFRTHHGGGRRQPRTFGPGPASGWTNSHRQRGKGLLQCRTSPALTITSLAGDPARPVGAQGRRLHLAGTRPVRRHPPQRHGECQLGQDGGGCDAAWAGALTRRKRGRGGPRWPAASGDRRIHAGRHGVKELGGPGD